MEENLLGEIEVENKKGNEIFYRFWKFGCAPCEVLKKILYDVNPNNIYCIVNINTIENPELVAMYDITSVPTIVRLSDCIKFTGLPKEKKYTDLIRFLEGN